MSEDVVDFNNYLHLKPLPEVLWPLRSLQRWVIWRLLMDDGKVTKPPYQPMRPARLASINNPGDWATYAIALANAPWPGGIGFIIGGGIAAIDLDACRDPMTGVADEWAQKIIDRCGTYVEVTVSRTGFRVIGLGQGPHIHKSVKMGLGKYELYRMDKGRYITISGHQVGSCVEMRVIDDLIDELATVGKEAVGGGIDTTGSGYGLRFLMSHRRQGYDAARTALLSNKGRAGDWARRVDERQLQRAWDQVLAHDDTARRRSWEEKEGDGPRILTGREFIDRFVPPNYLVEDLLQCGWLYTLTGRTGSGKTAFLMRLAAMVAGLEGAFGVHRINTRGKVLYFAGENADDVRQRYMALCSAEEVKPEDLDLFFIEDRTTLSQDVDRIRTRATQLGDLTMVIVDSMRAYFEGDNENDNVQMADYARLLRDLLTTLPGRPCVIAAGNPVKRAAEDDLLPAGGGSFLDAIDGNLACARKGDVSEVHWQGKFRGSDFIPVKFELVTGGALKLVDTRGRPLKTVLARMIADDQYEKRRKGEHNRENSVLCVMFEKPEASMRDIARALGWLVAEGKMKGEPTPQPVQRAQQNLLKDGLLRNYRDALILTKKGKEEAKKILETEG